MHKNNSSSLDEHQIFLQGPVVVFKWKNAEGWPVEYVSSNIEVNFGYKKEDLLSGRVKYADCIFKEDLQRIANEVSNYSSSSCHVFEQEYRLVKPNGDVLWVYDYTTVVRDETGAITHFYGYILDTTKHKRNEEMLRRAEKLNTVGEFAAGMAHEIKNPLTSLKGFLKLIKTGEAKKEYMTIMESELSRIELILNELLVISKPSHVRFEQKNICTLLQEIWPLFEMQILDKNIQLAVEYAHEELFVKCEENQLKQVFINLVKNAIEAMPDGGQIKVKCQKEQDEVVIRFIDEGQGIPQENINRLGTPFFTTKKNGTGLGLMVSFGIIEKHSGSVHIKSEPGKGTTFEVKLPFYQENPPA